MSNWKHADAWKRRGTNFLIEVYHHEVEPSSFLDEGPHRWAVYAYIYPEHPHFEKFDGSNMWQDATQVMPLHSGASLLEYPMYDGEVTSVKVGADYHHLHDEHTNTASEDDAWSIFVDAENLFNWLEARK